MIPWIMAFVRHVLPWRLVKLFICSRQNQNCDGTDANWIEPLPLMEFQLSRTLSLFLYRVSIAETASSLAAIIFSSFHRSFCLPRKSDSPLPQNICLTTLGLGFFVPFFRELLFAYGFIGVGKKSVNAAFKKVELKDGKPEKKAILICIGGAREAMWSTPGKWVNRFWEGAFFEEII